ncbi:MAG: hypothetical protein IJ097_01395 [Bacilli bacterium]|nr:hypothetical protein [Bacilli bacterium]
MTGILFLIGGIILIIGTVTALSIFLYFKIKLRKVLDAAGFEGQNIGDIIKEARLQDEIEPKSLASMDRIYLSQIQEDFPGINISEIKRQAEQVILDCYSCVEKNNSKKLKGKIKSFVDKMISEYDGKNVKFDEFKIHNTVLSNYKKDDKTASIFFASAYEYVLRVDGKEKKVQDRAKTEFIYVLDEHELADNQNAIGVHCPNCNSPITDIEHKTCNYCGTQVVLVLGRVFACNDIRRY